MAVGASTLAPSRRERRFADPAWHDNPLLRRLLQSYLATSAVVEGIPQDVPMDLRDGEHARFAITNLVQGLAPSNNPMTSPHAWKAAIDTGGLSLARGAPQPAAGTTATWAW